MQLQGFWLEIELATLGLYTNALPTAWATEAGAVSLGASSVYIYIYKL